MESKGFQLAEDDDTSLPLANVVTTGGGEAVEERKAAMAR